MAVFKANKDRWTKDGRKWFFQCYYKDLQGNRKLKRSKLFLKQEEAKLEERKFLSSLELGEQSNNMTIKDLTTKYIEFQKDRVRITTITGIKKEIKYIKSLNKIKLRDFNVSHFNQWKKQMKETKLSTNYQNTIYKTFRAILNHGIKYYNLNFLSNVMLKMTNFTNPNELQKEMLFYTYDEFKQFIKQERDLKYKCFFETLYYCGLRKGEANALTWGDIDFDKKTININKGVNLKIKGQKYVILPTKTKGSIRTLPISNILLNDLKTLKKEYNKYNNYSEEWFLFGGIYPLADTSIQVHNSNNSKLANIKKIRIHDFRHSCASLLINNGANINLVAKYLGHSDIATTLNTYTHMFKNQFDEITDMINNLK